MGVEIGGAVKNVLAVGAGLSDGLGFGANTRVALITRGLEEMTRLGVALGAQARHLHGARRARRPGADLHRRPVAQPPLRAAAGRRRQPRRRRWRRSARSVEGYHAAGAIRAVAAQAGVEMPLCEVVYRVLYEGLPPPQAVRELMSRPIKAEAE